MDTELDRESRRRERDYSRGKIPGLIKCICRLNHTRCKAFRYQNTGCFQPPFSDHVSNWIQSGRRLWVSQPYVGNRLPEIIKASEDYAKRRGLLVRFSVSESWHLPGETILIEYRSRFNPPLNRRDKKTL